MLEILIAFILRWAVIGPDDIITNTSLSISESLPVIEQDHMLKTSIVKDMVPYQWPSNSVVEYVIPHRRAFKSVVKYVVPYR